MTAGPFDGFIKKRPDVVGYSSTTVERSVQQKKQKSIYKLAEHYYYVL